MLLYMHLAALLRGLHGMLNSYTIRSAYYGFKIPDSSHVL